jgi:hypothetical protein
MDWLRSSGDRLSSIDFIFSISIARNSWSKLKFFFDCGSCGIKLGLSAGAGMPQAYSGSSVSHPSFAYAVRSMCAVHSSGFHELCRRNNSPMVQTVGCHQRSSRRRRCRSC